MTSTTSANLADATVSRPRGERARPESLRTGTTRPKEVAESAMARSRGLSTQPAAAAPSPTTVPSTSETRYPSAATCSDRPRSARTSSSRPTMNSRKASPTTASTWTGRSAENHAQHRWPQHHPGDDLEHHRRHPETGKHRHGERRQQGDQGDDEEVGESDVRHARLLKGSDETFSARAGCGRYTPGRFQSANASSSRSRELGDSDSSSTSPISSIVRRIWRT